MLIEVAHDYVQWYVSLFTMRYFVFLLSHNQFWVVTRALRVLRQKI